jgi:ornithine--oxo-acid transaminase
MGEIFRSRMEMLVDKFDIIKLVRGKGLLNAVVINDSEAGDTAWNICMKLKEKGLLAKPTHGNIIRFAPPLIIAKDQILDCSAIIEDTFDEMFG